MAEQWEERLRNAAEKFTLSETDRARILAKSDAKQKRIVCDRRRLKLAAAFCLIVALTLFPWGINPENSFEGIYVYAAAEDGGWNRLEVGEKQRLIRTYKSGAEECILYMELPEGYLFEKEYGAIGEDYIHITRGGIYWAHYDGNPKLDGKVSFRLLYTDENGSRIDTLELIMSREEGECYAELRRIQ